MTQNTTKVPPREQWGDALEWITDAHVKCSIALTAAELDDDERDKFLATAFVCLTKAVAALGFTLSAAQQPQSDLVKRLRERVAVHKGLEADNKPAEPWPNLFSESADRIEALEAAAAQPTREAEGPTLDEIKSWLTDVANPGCKNCDGFGLFYGNVCICGCVNDAPLAQREAALAEVLTKITDTYDAYRAKGVLPALEYADVVRAIKDASKLLTTEKRGMGEQKPHVLFKTADKDRPEFICDQNGEVVLALCKLCGRGEIELSEPCGGEMT